MATGSQIRSAAAAIANARGGRKGVPVISNILDVLPPKLVDEVLEDAKAALDAARGPARAPAPGSWRVERCDDGALMVCTEGDVICLSDPNNPDNTATMQQISATPDLLAVVKRGRQKLATFTTIYAGDKELRELLAAWDAAIAKAEAG